MPGPPPSSPPPGRAVAREAATVVLARDGASGVEVPLLERHPGNKMAGGAFAFPGGRVERADAAPGVERLCRGLTRTAAAQRLPDVAPPDRAIGFWVAALREAFEEAAILLAYDPAGALLVPDTGARGRLAGDRVRCRADAGAFRGVLEAGRFTLATDRLVYFAHWITPEERPVRYDARFFVAAASPQHEPDPDGLEVVGGRWLPPAVALAQAAAGALPLPFVTQRILRSLETHPTVSALLDAARRADIRPIRPRLVVSEAGERVLLPGDPGYF